MKETQDLSHEESSGNVFVDLGLQEPEVEDMKVQLSVKIFQIIKRKKLTQVQVGHLLGVSQPEVSKLKQGQYHRFSLERLLCFLNRLHYNIDIKLSVARGTHAYQRVVGGRLAFQTPLPSIRYRKAQG